MRIRQALAVLLVLPTTLPAQARPGRTPVRTAAPATPVAVTAARYRVRAVPGQAYEVRADFTFSAARDTVLVSLPTWSAGSYGIENYARWVHGVRAEADGRPAPWDKTGPSTWRIAAGGSRSVALEFRTNPDSLDLSMSALRTDFGFFNGTNLLVYPDSVALVFPSDIAVEVPAGWRIATGLDELAPGRYHAADYHDLVDAPFFLGHFAMDSVLADGRYVRFAIHPDSALTPAVWDSVGDALRRLAVAQNRIFGGPPYASYTVLFLAPFREMAWGGGLEHHNSQLDAIAAPFFATDRATGRLGDFTRPLLSHEMFHLFNVKRIRPAELWPYDYSREQPTPLLWWSEGVTDYYSDVTLTRSGLWTPDRFVQSVQGNIAQVEDAAEIVAAEDASVDTWIKPQFVDESQYYYPKGSLLGLMLDIQVRRASAGRHSLDDVMRALYTDFYQRGRGFTTQDLLGIIRPWWAGVDDFYARYVNGREPLPYQEVLPRAGIAVAVQESRAPWFGVAAPRTLQGGVQIDQVSEGSMAAGAGLQAGDVLLRIGDVTTTDPDTFGQAFRARYRNAEGQEVEVAYRRGAQQLTARVPLQMRVSRSYRLSREAQAPSEVRATLAGILGQGALNQEGP
jgi:predicted metalloprotease with PDZ domain